MEPEFATLLCQCRWPKLLRAENGRYHLLLGRQSGIGQQTASRYLHRPKRGRPPRLRVANRWLHRLLGFRREEAGNTARRQLRGRKHRRASHLRGAHRPNPHLLGGSGIAPAGRMRDPSDYGIHWLGYPANGRLRDRPSRNSAARFPKGLQLSKTHPQQTRFMIVWDAATSSPEPDFHRPDW